MVLLSVVLPTYNEADQIAGLLGELDSRLRGVDYEIVVVDDNSPDGTHARVEACARANPRVVPVLRRGERGLATAVLEGFRRSRGTYVVTMDSDGQHPPEAVPRLLAAAQRDAADVVVASRYVPGGSQEGFALRRRVISWGARTLAVLALPPVRRFRIRDPMSGFFLARRDRVPVDRLRPRGYKILIEVLAQSGPQRVAEVGYAFHPRRGGASKLRLATQVDYARQVLGLSLRDPDNRRLATFTLVGASGTVVNLFLLALLIDGAGWGERWQLPWRGQVLLVGTLLGGAVAREASILWNFAWNDRITFHRERRGAEARILERLFRFHVVSLWSFLVYLLAFYPLVHLRVHYLVAGAIAIVAGFIVNYAGHLRWTYAQRRDPHGH